LRLSSKAESRLWEEVCALCCRTGNDGDPVAKERWQFFARIWITPYRQIAPQWTFVAVADDKVVGYLTGCPNSRKFRRQKFFFCDLPLVIRTGARIMTASGDEWRYLKQVVGLAKGAEAAFPVGMHKLLRQDYLAHLHMNVEAGFRNQGVGRRLLTNYLDDLRRAGVSGVHLYCGARPLEFYQRMGFLELGRISIGNLEVFALGRHL
jgi:GNAT superfamily N-acetyltransferase